MSDLIQPQTQLCQTILVQGATGNTGFATINSLLISQPHPFHIKAGVHDVSKVDKIEKLVALGQQVEVVHLDTEYPQTVRAALRGVNKVMLCPPNTEDRVEAAKLLIQAAVDSGTVDQIVLISILSADKCAVSFQKQFFAIEQYLERCGLAFTILRCPFFMEDFYFFASHLLGGQLRLPLGEGSTVMMSTQDVGECAAVVLSSCERVHYRKCYNLTGPDALDGVSMAAALSEALEISITYYSISSAEAKNMFLSVGFDPTQAAGFIELFQLLSLGAGELVSQESACLLGRPPIPLTVWAKEHRLALAERATEQMYSPTTLTNEQGQQTVNQQGQQGSVSNSGKAKERVYTVQSPKLSTSIPVQNTTRQTLPVFQYQRGPFPHLVGHSEQWNATYLPLHEERRQRSEYERSMGVTTTNGCSIS